MRYENHAFFNTLKQTAEYMDRCGSEDAHLIVFDRRPKKRWKEKIFRRTEKFEGKKIEVWDVMNGQSGR